MTKNFLGTPLIVSEHGARLDELTWYIHGLMFVLFIGWLIYFLYVLLRFRATRNAQADHVGVQSHYSTWVEVGVAVIEGVLLIGFAVPLWASAVDKFPEEKSSTLIRITGQQFAWNARYPGTNGVFGKQDVKFVDNKNPLGIDPSDAAGKDDILVQTPGTEIVVPLGVPVIMQISSLDVIHSFKVFPMRVNQDAIPGMAIPIHFTPTQVGTYPINCAQLCGVGHYSMKAALKVVPAAEFATWLQSKVGAAKAGDFE